MKISQLLLCLACLGFGTPPPDSWQTPFEQGGETQSATYAEAIEYYQRLASTYEEAHLWTYGATDVGEPLQVLVLSKEPNISPFEAKASGKPILLINNGIHPGEPCGIDASMMLARDLLQTPEKKAWLEDVIVAIIPVYNIGGALNRGSDSRANQLGPEAYGFRGNARNYDLNRDFVKADTRNAQAFHHIFQDWFPHLMIDTHTTNGADYPAVLTYITNTESRTGLKTQWVLEDALIPALTEHMAKQEIPVNPYVYGMGKEPRQGIKSFLNLPRYSTGYASLFQTMAFITEAHMLKSFPERVWATYHWLAGTIAYAAENGEQVVEAVEIDRLAIRARRIFPVDWTLDREQVDSLWFSGYEAKTKPSEVTGAERMYYDRDEPYQDSIPFYQTYQPTTTINAPEAYLIPQAEQKVLQRLQQNGVKLAYLSRDTILEVEVGYIRNLETSRRSYEGHFVHQKLELERMTQSISFRKGDAVVWLNQDRNAYIVHVLEPEARDSFFRWNYFDGILMRKEYFSPYVFEDEAAKMLAEDPELQAKFEEAKANDPAMAAEPYLQLDFLYRSSPHYESTYNRYPIFFFRQSSSLPLD
ncbi:MAG: M14 family zinc carboxypeptidase [Bacteroidota bacterium]